MRTDYGTVQPIKLEDGATIERLPPDPLIERILTMNERILDLNTKLLDALAYPQYIMKERHQ